MVEASLRSDAQPRPPGLSPSTGLAPSAVDNPGINHIHCTGSQGWGPGGCRCHILNAEGSPWLPLPPTTLTMCSMSDFLLKHASKDMDFILFCFAFLSPEVLDGL